MRHAARAAEFNAAWREDCARVAKVKGEPAPGAMAVYLGYHVTRTLGGDLFIVSRDGHTVCRSLTWGEACANVDALQ